MSDTEKYIRQFCEENAYKYTIYEDYSGRYMFGRKCLGVIVKQYYSYMEFFMDLTKYLSENNVDDYNQELEGVGIDELGMDSVVYFPRMER